MTVALDERLRRAIERASRLADPSGVYDELIRRKERRRIARRLQAGALAVLVVAGSMTGVYVLSRAFDRPGSGAAAPTVGNGRIAYITYEDGSRLFPLNSVIHTVNPDGSDPVRLAEIPGMIGGLDWAPDGTRVAFTAPREEPADVALFVMGADGSGLRELGTVGSSLVGSLSWSPDGTRIAYLDTWHGTTAVYVLDVATGERSRVTGEDLDVATPDWSPDGTSIVFAAEEPDVLPEIIDLFKVDLQTLEIEQLTDAPELDFDPGWSPDGNKIVFRSRRDRVLPQGQCCDPYDEIYVMNANGTQQTRLTFDESRDQSPVWSPDGLKIAYSSQCCLEKAAIVIMDPDGSDPQRLPIGAVEFAWQPVLTEESVQPIPTETTSPEPRPTGPTGTSGPSERDVPTDLLGVGPVCGVTTVEGRFLGNAKTEAYVFEPEPEGGCAGPNEDFQYLGIADPSGTVVVVSDKLTSCLAGIGCWAFAAPYVDQDGITEIAVGIGTTGGSSEFEIYTVAGGVIRRLGFDCSNCNAGTFLWGRTDGHAEGIYCLPPNTPQDFVMWNAERTDGGDRYSVVELTIDVKGSFLTQTDRRDSVVPYDTTALPAGGGDDFCGTPASPPPGA